jgi:putative holliday junction resolvase
VPVPVEMYDERFTTAIAARGGARGARASEDSRAAAVLLEDWLARHAGQGAR